MWSVITFTVTWYHLLALALRSSDYLPFTTLLSIPRLGLFPALTLFHLDGITCSFEFVTGNFCSPNWLICIKSKAVIEKKFWKLGDWSLDVDITNIWATSIMWYFRWGLFLSSAFSLYIVQSLPSFRQLWCTSFFLWHTTFLHPKRFDFSSCISCVYPRLLLTPSWKEANPALSHAGTCQAPSLCG